MTSAGKRISVVLILALLAAGVLGWPAIERMDLRRASPERKGKAVKAVPVEVAAVGHGEMELRRTFSGALEAPAQFVVAPKVSGRIEQLYVRLADTVSRGQVVARLDDDEHVQAVEQAQANLEVARANLAGAQSALEIAARELERMRTLRQRGMVSEAQFDTARAKQLDSQSRSKVAQALVSKAESELRSAGIRLGYTKVTADWADGSDRRIVAERYVHEGETVTANQQLLRIVELAPITAVIFVAERDYARLRNGQVAALATDAFPGRRFEGRIARIAPVFREATRQARVELTIANEQRLLKPGMFIRATIVLDRVADATHVPEEALAVREGDNGVFVVSADGTSVAWRRVEPGIRDGRRVQVTGEKVSGQVVVLGQQLLDDGSAILIETEVAAAPPARARRKSP